MSFNRAILNAYAHHSAPETLPPHRYFAHSKHTVTVFDAFPKAHFHFLVIPRVQRKGPLNDTNLSSLKTLLNSPDVGKSEAVALLRRIKEDAERVRTEIEEEMVNFFGFAWGVIMGFHAIQSMDHMHLHVISDDLCAPGMKTKKHYNSFHPKLGFFLHLDEVLSWFEDDKAESYFQSMIKLNESSYDYKLKEPLECHHCKKEQKNMPQLKAHLQEHFTKLAAKKKEDAEDTEKIQKRKLEEAETEDRKAEDCEGDAIRKMDKNMSVSPGLKDQSDNLPRKKQKKS